MITEKDFTYVGLNYINPNLTYDPNYNYTELTFNNGGCKLSRLKNRHQRFLAFWWDGTSTMELMEKSYKDKVIKLTCLRTKLLDLPMSELKLLKTRILKSLSAWKIQNVKDVIIYAI